MKKTSRKDRQGRKERKEQASLGDVCVLGVLCVRFFPLSENLPNLRMTPLQSVKSV
jgi:hypothetical protein